MYFFSSFLDQQKSQLAKFNRQMIIIFDTSYGSTQKVYNE